MRKDYWRIFSEAKEEYLKYIEPKEIFRFIEKIKEKPPVSPAFRLQEMTAGLFFDFCRLGYKANEYKGTKKVTSKALYQMHAGRDERLLNIDETSASAFETWFHDKNRFAGHPFEVCRGFNSAHISLYVNQDERGWWLILAGSSIVRSVETVKFYLALVESGLPVFLIDGLKIADKLSGRDYIGIVPEGITPAYFGSMFPDEKILDFMNLPWERTKEVIEATIWHPIEKGEFILSNFSVKSTTESFCRRDKLYIDVK